MKATVLYDSDRTGALLDDFCARLQEVCEDRQFALVGIHRRGDVIAERLRRRIVDSGGDEPSFGLLDITLYRDDFGIGKPQPTVRPSEIPFEVDGADVLLVDDVFQTGRTIRAALNQLADFGRARSVVLAVFIDRNLRELPIRPDLVGLEIDRPAGERVQLELAEVDGRDRILVIRDVDDDEEPSR